MADPVSGGPALAEGGLPRIHSPRFRIVAITIPPRRTGPATKLQEKRKGREEGGKPSLAGKPIETPKPSGNWQPEKARNTPRRCYDPHIVDNRNCSDKKRLGTQKPPTASLNGNA